MVSFDRLRVTFWRHFFTCCVTTNKEKLQHNLASTGVSNVAEVWGFFNMETDRLLCTTNQAEIQVFSVASRDLPSLSARAPLLFLSLSVYAVFSSFTLLVQGFHVY